MSKQFSLLDPESNEGSGSIDPVVHTLPKLYSLSPDSSLTSFPDANRQEITAKIIEYPNLISRDHCHTLRETLIKEIVWEQCSIQIAGKKIPVPRLQCWMGDRQSQYSYSGMRLSPLPWHSDVSHIKQLIEQRTGHRYNSVLLNYYRDEYDSVAWHADDEIELGPKPVIASFSLGNERMFELKPKPPVAIPRKRYRNDACDKDLNQNSSVNNSRGNKLKFKLPLQDGQLIVMEAGLQEQWLHQVPKSREKCGARINLTFRWIQ